jgi:hypothetical protein
MGHLPIYMRDTQRCKRQSIFTQDELRMKQEWPLSKSSPMVTNPMSSTINSTHARAEDTGGSPLTYLFVLPTHFLGLRATVSCCYS